MDGEGRQGEGSAGEVAFLQGTCAECRCLLEQIPHPSMLMTGRRCGDVFRPLQQRRQVLECCCGGCPQELALALQHVDSAESFLDTIFP